MIIILFTVKKFTQTQGIMLCYETKVP